MADRLMIICKTLRESPMGSIDWWTSIG